eukprot:SAG11_NODE_2283_length_3572_cov_10.306651_3_plen_106_part_00
MQIETVHCLLPSTPFYPPSGLCRPTVGGHFCFGNTKFSIRCELTRESLHHFTVDNGTAAAGEPDLGRRSVSATPPVLWAGRSGRRRAQLGSTSYEFELRLRDGMS